MKHMVLSMAALVVLMNYLFTRTKWGRSVFAVGGNAEAARRTGIPVRRIYASTYLLDELQRVLRQRKARCELRAVDQLRCVVLFVCLEFLLEVRLEDYYSVAQLSRVTHELLIREPIGRVV